MRIEQKLGMKFSHFFLFRLYLNTLGFYIFEALDRDLQFHFSLLSSSRQVKNIYHFESFFFFRCTISKCSAYFKLYSRWIQEVLKWYIFKWHGSTIMWFLNCAKYPKFIGLSYYFWKIDKVSLKMQPNLVKSIDTWLALFFST